MSSLFSVIKWSFSTVKSQGVLRESFSMIWASFGNSLTTWLTVSPSALLHIVHFVYSCDVSIFLLIILVRMNCSCPAHIKLSILHFRVPFCNHCHLSWFLTSLVCLTTRPCNIFFLIFFLLVVLSLYCSFSDWLNQINIQRCHSNKENLSGFSYIVP